MSRNTERILFTIVGVFIVLFGYILGNFDSAIQAQQDDLPVYDNLLVRESIVIGNIGKHHVAITAKENGATITINHHKKGFCGRVLISADDDGSSIMMSHAEGYDLFNDHVNSVIWMTTDKQEVAKIMLADQKGRKDLTTN